MIQEERKERSRQEIFRAAREEFGSRDYGQVNMESICKNHGISKGMMYHYFSNKDELFLLCVERTFTELSTYLEQEIPSQIEGDVSTAIQKFFLAREVFFQSRPREKTIFENALIYPPKHLIAQIQTLHAPLRELNRRFLLELVPKMPTRPGLERDEIIRYLEGVGCLFRTIIAYGREEGDIRDLHTMMAAGEKLVDMVLFGIFLQPPLTQTEQPGVKYPENKERA